MYLLTNVLYALTTSFFLYFFIAIISFILVQVQLSPFSFHHFPQPTHPHLPPSILPCFGFVLGSFIQVPWQPFRFFPPLSPPSVSSDYCQFVLYFKVSGYILLASLFCLLGSTYRWHYMAFLCHLLAYFT